MQIFCANADETILFAAEELKKYILLMDKKADVCITKEENADIKLGLLSDLNVSEEGVEDAWYDDLYDICIEKGKGYIAGSNPRSVLYGVYAFLKSAGCEWVRPGKDGDFVPETDILNYSFTERKLSDMRFRGQMIEGAIAVEHVLDSVDWMAKLGYNCFCIQFVYPYVFYKRYYEHYYNPFKEDEKVSLEQMREFTYQIEKAIKTRGMQLHNLGHGFFFEPFGIAYDGNTEDIPENIKQYVAMLNGKRELNNHSVNYTQLCYSNPVVRKMLVDYLVKYMKERNRTDVLHVYYSDSVNNHCECDECRKLTPTDFFIMILNELEDAFQENGIEAKVLFDLYGDVLWPPIKERLKNPDRILLTVALSRNYSAPLPPKKIRKIPEFQLNKYNPFRGEAKTALDYYEAWKPVYDKPFISCTYDNYADHFYDPGHFQISRRIADDMTRYPEFNCMGIMDCQTMRYGFPTALPGSIMGSFAFDRSLDFDSYTDTYFKGAFGKDWKKARAYLEGITDLSCPCNLRCTEDVVIQDTQDKSEAVNESSYINNPEVQKKLSEIPAFVDAFAETIAENLNISDPCQKLSWEYLKHHGTYCKMFAEYFLHMSKLDPEAAYEVNEKMMNWLFSHEEEFGRHLDIFLLNHRLLRLMVVRMRRRVGLPELFHADFFGCRKKK